MTTLYWVLEFSKVFFAYIFILFVWPMTVFRKYLRGKSLTFRFGFCATVQIVIVNTAVLTLGLLHILNPWIIRVLFYGTFVYSIVKDIKIGEKQKKQIGRLLVGTYGMKSFGSNISTIIIDRIKGIKKSFLNMMRSHWWEYGLFAIILIYGVTYFSYGAFQDYSYGFGDMYPHNAWVYGLLNGQIFSAGVYPEGMHCFIYSMHVLFDIRVYSCMLFTAGIHTLVFLVSAYALLKEVFRWKYSPMLALTLFLTVDLMCINEIYSMSRLQWTIPQDFGLYTQFLCAAFLLRYLKGEKQESKLQRWKVFRKSYWNENLMVFMLALAASIIIHFYPTIMAFFLCISFVPLMLKKIFTNGRFSALVFAVICGAMIAILPMGGALASGIKFQGSIGWAMTIINGTEGQQQSGSATNDTVEKSQSDNIQDVSLKENEETEEISSNIIVDEELEKGENIGKDVVSQSPIPAPITIPEPSFTEKLVNIVNRIWDTLVEKANIIYHEAYITLYQRERANWILGFSVVSIVIWLIWRVISGVLKLVYIESDIDTAYFDEYPGLVVITVIFMMLYCEGKLGIPALIAGSRVCAVAQLLIVAMCTIPLDFMFASIAMVLREGVMKVVATFCVAGIYVGTMLTDTFHGYLYYELTRYNGAVMTTYSITDKFPKNSFTIVSTVDELYQVIQYGYHEEVITFVNKSITGDYTIPTEYVFIYVEKNPLEYAQSHFFEGPKWLARETYPQYYSTYVSQCPDINSSAISEEFARQPYTKLPENSKMYSNLATRTVLESRLDAWCKEFDRLYPNELHTYYEDEDFVCYYFKQNPYSLFQLAIQ